MFLLIFCKFIAAASTKGKNDRPIPRCHDDQGETSQLDGRDPTLQHEADLASNWRRRVER